MLASGREAKSLITQSETKEPDTEGATETSRQERQYLPLVQGCCRRCDCCSHCCCCCCCCFHCCRCLSALQPHWSSPSPADTTSVNGTLLLLMTTRLFGLPVPLPNTHSTEGVSRMGIAVKFLREPSLPCSLPSLPSLVTQN